MIVVACPFCGSKQSRVLVGTSRECLICRRTFELPVQRESVSITDACALLGVSRWTIWRLVREGKLEVFSVRGCKRIHLSELRRLKRARAEV